MDDEVDNYKPFSVKVMGFILPCEINYINFAVFALTEDITLLSS